MPPELDLSRSTHAKIMAVPPRINLRRAASYQNYERSVAAVAGSSSSSRFNFNHLLFSPPPSPSLPALVPRRKRSPSQILTARPSRIVRLLTVVCGFAITIYFLVCVCDKFITSGLDAEFEMVGQDTLPDFPTPIMAKDTHGRSKWSVSIPRDYTFPLSIGEYTDMCKKCHEVSTRTRTMYNKGPLSEQVVMNQSPRDSYFVDVMEAEKTGLLPGALRGVAPKDAGHFVGSETGHMEGKPVCQSSLTFVLESSDAGIGRTLMTVWTLFALAQEQGRAFFIDDSRWAYGSYSNIFDETPLPNCRPPPRHHMLPCPVQARHLVVSGATAKAMLPVLLAKHRRMSGKTSGPRDELELARIGYNSLFNLTSEDERYVQARVQDLKSKASAVAGAITDAPIIGLHVRHGDQHPYEFQYKDTYIPMQNFLSMAEGLVETYYNQVRTNIKTRRFLTVIASDDPTVVDEPDLLEAHPAQDRIRLATKESTPKTNVNPHVLHPFVEEMSGWEGGFFASVFWNIGANRNNNAANAPVGINAATEDDDSPPTSEPSEETVQLRNFIGRAYMMDLAVLARSSDSVVCAVSAMGCRILGVMMGWEEVAPGGRWHNVDGAYGWSGVDW